MCTSIFKTAIRAAFTAVCGAYLVSCGGGSGGGEDLTLPQQVKQYYDKDVALTSVTNNYSAYFDLSDGVVLAYKKNKDAAAFLNSTVQRLTSGDSCGVYSLAASQITPLNLKQTELYNKIMDEKSYAQQMAPIEKTLEKIVKEGKSCLMVTDFEEFTPDHKVQHQSFATRYFVDWLKQGKDITFFVFDFVGVKNIPYHLYFIVFDNKSHQFLNNIKEAVAGVSGYKEFHLSRDAYSVSTNYPTSAKGGNYHDAESGEDVITGVLEDGSEIAYTGYGEGARLEFYPFGVKWQDALENSKEATQEGFNPKYTHLFRNLFFDFSNQDSYIIKKLDLKVTDVEEDFEKYTDYREALADKEKESDYYGEDGKLLPEYDYAKNTPKTVEIKDMLVLDQDLFNKTMQQSGGKKVEIGIGFSPYFKGDIIGGDPSDLYRVDVVIAESQPNIGPRLDELFSWGANNNLRDAIRNTLQVLNPKGTVIYTYFVKTI